MSAPAQCRSGGGSIAPLYTDRGVSCHAYDEPHVVRIADGPAKRPELEPLDFADAQIVGTRKRGELDRAALVVKVDGRTLILRIGRKAPSDPDRPSTGSSVIEAQEVQFDGSDWEQNLTAAQILSHVTPLDSGQMGDLLPILKGSDALLCHYRDAIHDFLHAEHRANLQPLPQIDFAVIRDLGRDGRSGHVLLRVAQGHLALFRAGANIYAEEVVLLQKDKKWLIKDSVSHPRILEPHEISQLREAVGSQGGEAAKSLFPEQYAKNDR